jgi:hypothetical protein
LSSFVLIGNSANIKKDRVKSDSNVTMATDGAGDGDVGRESTRLKPIDVEAQRTERRN